MESKRKSQSTENLTDNSYKEFLLGILLLAHKAGEDAHEFEEIVKRLKTKYPKKFGFTLDKMTQSIHEYINNLEQEIKENKEFLDYVIRNYSSDKNSIRKTGKVFKAGFKRD